MEHIYRSELVEQYLETYGISQAFSCKGLQFYAVQYNTGELIASPQEKKRDLQFLLSKDVWLYRLRDDGGIYSVEVPISKHPLLVLGDVEFARPGTPYFFAEAKQKTISLGLPIRPNSEKLLNNPEFLFYLLGSLADKVSFASHDQKASLEERLIYRMQHIEPQHTICFIEETATALSCSSRQLSRILNKLIEEGRVVKIKRGYYRLSDDYTSIYE